MTDKVFRVVFYDTENDGSVYVLNVKAVTDCYQISGICKNFVFTRQALVQYIFELLVAGYRENYNEAYDQISLHIGEITPDEYIDLKNQISCRLCLIDPTDESSMKFLNERLNSWLDIFKGTQLKKFRDIINDV